MGRPRKLCGQSRARPTYARGRVEDQTHFKQDIGAPAFERLEYGIFGDPK